MDLKQLNSFVHIYNEKSFSRAAKKLFITQPTISNHIRLLENELNVTLFNRNGKMITPTEAGKLLYKHAKEMRNLKEDIYTSFNVYKNELEGTLLISASSIPSQYFLPKILTEFHNRNLGVTFKLKQYDSKQVIDKLKNNLIDFGIIGSYEDDESLEFLQIVTDELKIIAPKHIELTSVDDILECPLIIREKGSGTRKHMINMFEQNNLKLSDFNIVAEVEDNETILNLVLNKLGISFISQKALDAKSHTCLDNINIYSFDEFSSKRNFYFVYHTKRNLSPLARNFKNFILDKNKAEN